MPKARRLAIATLTLALTAPLAAQSGPELQYQDRGDRHEGLWEKPVQGYDVELLSARVDYREERDGWPERMRLRFYLPGPDEVFITVRQPRPKSSYYWLDLVKPNETWRPGAFNDYAWPTATVLRKLTSVTADDLGAVVRLRQELPGRKERIAPVVVYGDAAPVEVSGYRFTFKTNGTGRVTCRIYRGQTEIFARPRNRELAGSPFTVRWNSAGEPDGEYRLVVSGYFETDNEQFLKEVVFHHRARLVP